MKRTPITPADREHAVDVAREVINSETGTGVTHRPVDSREAYLLAATIEHAMFMIGRLTVNQGRATEALEGERRSIAASHAALDALGVPRVREVTGETITDEEIKKYREYVLRQPLVSSAAVDDAVRICNWAAPDFPSRTMRVEARARCAAAFNALPESDRLLTLAERIQWLAARNGARQ